MFAKNITRIGCTRTHKKVLLIASSIVPLITNDTSRSKSLPTGCVFHVVHLPFLHCFRFRIHITFLSTAVLVSVRAAPCSGPEVFLLGVGRRKGVVLQHTWCLISRLASHIRQCCEIYRSVWGKGVLFELCCLAHHSHHSSASAPFRHGSVRDIVYFGRGRIPVSQTKRRACLVSYAARRGYSLGGR